MMQPEIQNPNLIGFFKQELNNILQYWTANTLDDEFGGFIGQIDENENRIEHADKGAVLNARLLWTFAAAYNYNQDPQSLALAKRGYIYILEHFIDKEWGGVFWSVNHKGSPVSDKKQIYAIAFTIYALAEYFKATKEAAVLALAISLFCDIEKHSFDPKQGGYFEAFTRDWMEIEDIRLSLKDQNDKKTMNTHLHILEAYTNLYVIWPDDVLKTQIQKLISVFIKHILADTNHLNLFFDDHWGIKSNTISYGHDIEASWLLLEAAEAIGDDEIIYELKKLAVSISLAAAQGMDKDGGLNYEFNQDNAHLDRDKHWWVQAEALVGFYNAWQLSNDDFFKDQFNSVLNFIQAYLIDHKHGEWFWAIDVHHQVLPNQVKVGFWKCPYHNGRACLQLIKWLV